MTYSKMRQILVVCCAAAMLLLLVPTTTQACECLDWLLPWNWCRGGSCATASTYAPAYSVQYPVATQTCSYVPQTCYRTVMRTVPTTVYRPASYCDPCTGCATTCYSPITSYVRSAQLVPYTTYTPVWTNSCYTPCSTTSCGTTCGTSCGPSYTTTTSGCSSCATPAASSTLVPAPMQGTTTPPANMGQPANIGKGTTQPALPKTAPPPPYKQNKPIKPVPEQDIRESSTGGPQLDGPSFDRTTTRPIRQATYQAVSHNVAPRVDYGGWRASNR